MLLLMTFSLFSYITTLYFLPLKSPHYLFVEISHLTDYIGKFLLQLDVPRNREKRFDNETYSRLSTERSFEGSSFLFGLYMVFRDTVICATNGLKCEFYLRINCK